MKFGLLLTLYCASFVYGEIKILSKSNDEIRADLIAQLIKTNLKTNGWTTFLSVGALPDTLYTKISRLPLTFVTLDVEKEQYEIEDVSQYSPNIILISCKSFDDFENVLTNIVGFVYWHPLSNIILYLHENRQEGLEKLFYILWYYSVCNVIIIQYDDVTHSLLISNFTPYTSENYKLSKVFGCWKVTKAIRPIGTFSESFQCEERCASVSLNITLRSLHIGTCISFETRTVNYENTESLKKISLFEDKSIDLHGYVFRVYGVQVLPFLIIEDNGDGTFNFGSRDGTMWTILSKLMNFQMDITVGLHMVNKPFSIEINLEHIYKFARREIDLVMIPVYIMDLSVIQNDFTVFYRESGVCLASHRADFETFAFEMDNLDIVIRFLFCFVLIWFMFSVYDIVELRRFSCHQLGLSLLNTIRSVLMINIYKHVSVRISYRLFLSSVIWSFFAINFLSQASIVSLFAASKRGKEVNTFEDVVRKGYPIEGIMSPDMIIPENEEIFSNINSKLVPVQDLYMCINHLLNDSKLFCYIDCSVARYLERNRLDDKGEQYIHVATDARVHNNYLGILQHKHSPLTETFTKHLLRFFQAGLIRKWEQYRFAGIKEDSQFKPLAMANLIVIFKGFCTSIGISCAVFFCEMIIEFSDKIRKLCKRLILKRARERIVKKKLQLERKLGHIKSIDAFTQTVT